MEGKPMKSYTSVEQSKRLAEILPLESADMTYWKRSYRPNDYAITAQHSKELQEGFEAKCIEYIPCWSLAALIGVLPKGTNINTPSLINARYCCWNNYVVIDNINPVDVCYEMIIRLHELNLL